ncbi:hypothetical protein NEAUS03_0075 [Nematocida ausubeli]|nr:hypothetical protein NEAUS03_0075 [Nematocida ausubeli]
MKSFLYGIQYRDISQVSKEKFEELTNKAEREEDLSVRWEEWLKAVKSKKEWSQISKAIKEEMFSERDLENEYQWKYCMKEIAKIVVKEETEIVVIEEVKEEKPKKETNKIEEMMKIIIRMQIKREQEIDKERRERQEERERKKREEAEALEQKRKEEERERWREKERRLKELEEKNKQLEFEDRMRKIAQQEIGSRRSVKDLTCYTCGRKGHTSTICYWKTGRIL